MDGEHLSPYFSRTEFLRLSGLVFGSVLAAPYSKILSEQSKPQSIGTGRVTVQAISVFDKPTYKGERQRWVPRDSLVDLREEVYGKDGPAYNPRWYRVKGGYAHSAYLQRVEKAHLNQPLQHIRESGQLGEVTVPFTQSFHMSRSGDFTPLYRLYYGSVYWITTLIEGPDGDPWYGLTDDRLRVQYFVPASHLRAVTNIEMAPLSLSVPPDQKRIELSLTEQRLRAFEGEKLVFQATVASGIPSRGPSPNGIPTDTPPGSFRVSLKFPSRHMGDGDLTDDPEAYELPGVPWVTIFHAYGIGFHGTYWHDNFGTPMSHGCVNMRNEDAKWLFRWTTPRLGSEDWFRRGRGTTVIVR